MYRWSMFFTLNNSQITTSTYIRGVAYYLNQSYKDRKVVLDQSPFILSRISSESFIITAEIFFKEWTKILPIRIDHLIEL